MIAAVKRGIGTCDRLGRDHVFLASDRLRPDQQYAVHEVLASRDWAVSLRGAAGTGKTATLEEIQRGLREAGRDIVAVVPTRSAVPELHEVGFARSMTIEHLLRNREDQASLRGRVLIVDEAGMVSARQMTALLDLAEHQAARVVLSGDTRQLQSVEAGDALRILERESGLRSVSLTQVHRQTSETYRSAIETLREQPRRGFEQLVAMGAVREVPWEDRSRSVAEGYRSTGTCRCTTRRPRKRIRGSSRWDRCLSVMTVYRREVARRRSRLWGLSRSGFWSGPIRPTLALSPPPRCGDSTSASGGPVEIAPHDRLLLTANRQEPDFGATNGEIVTVQRVEHKRLCLDDGRVVPSTYKHVDHDYAVTAHRSQGQLVDSVVIVGERMTRELFYVAASRGREHLTMITSDQARLEASVGQSGARQSASELVRTMHTRVADGRPTEAPRGFARGIHGVVEEGRRSVAFERESQRDAVLAPVQQPAIHSAGYEGEAQVPPLEDRIMDSVDNEPAWTVDRDRRPYGVRVVLPSARTSCRGRNSCTRKGPRIGCMPYSACTTSL